MIPPAVRSALVEHAEAERPNEACGVVVFRDGEELVGTTQGYDRARPGFFVVPIDPGSNNERCFVIAKAALDVRFL